MSLTPPGEKVVETKKCRVSGEEFVVTDKDLEFYDKVSPVLDGKKYSIPSPNLSPDSRQQRRLAFRNERVYYNRKCDFSGKNVISIYPEKTRFPVYSYDSYFSDEWNPFDYGQDFSPNSPFFEQFYQLQCKVPRLYFSSTNCENSEYCNHAGNMKDSYLIVGSLNDEACMYGTRIFDCKNCIDCLFVNKSELCYECVNCQECYNLTYGLNCKSVMDSRWVSNSQSSKNLLFCTNRRQANYEILNKKCSQEEFKKVKEQILVDPAVREKYLSEYRKLFVSGSVQGSVMRQSENSVGNYIYNSRNIHVGFDIQDSENVKYAYDCSDVRDCMDIFSVYEAEYSYDSYSASMGVYHILFTRDCWPSSELIYCDHCFGCKNCFGCIGLRKKEFCIFNKQYDKKTYFQQVARILDFMQETGEWGEFFPIKTSPFAYNETVAHECFPLQKSEAESHGYRWYEGDSTNTQVTGLTKIPESITDTPDSICNETLLCQKTGKPFKIQRQELAFYRAMKLPVPRNHPDVRHKQRIMLRNPRKLWERNCDKCGVEIQTTYAPDRRQNVYCEECYRKEVY